MQISFIFLYVFAVALHSTSAVEVEVFRTDYSQKTLSEAFGGVQVSYGSQNVLLWENGKGINVTYPAGRYWQWCAIFSQKIYSRIVVSYTSYTPSVEPVGGFGVWTKEHISHTAILTYGIFFPAGFNFVKGGKLPGLYGGKTSCTGGDPAVDCFSTRIMWRADGQGELYLYANREAQDPAICENQTNM